MHTCTTGYEGGSVTCGADGNYAVVACLVQTCDLTHVSAPLNGTFGLAVCTSARGWIRHGQLCDLTCDDGFTAMAQPRCISGTLSSLTATCVPDTLQVVDMQPQQARSVKVQTRVDSLLSESDIVAALGSSDVEIVSITVTQQLEVPLRELPGDPSSYADLPACTPCQIKRCRPRSPACPFNAVPCALTLVDLLADTSCVRVLV
jgi:hypothetical protein